MDEKDTENQEVMSASCDHTIFAGLNEADQQYVLARAGGATQAEAYLEAGGDSTAPGQSGHRKEQRAEIQRALAELREYRSAILDAEDIRAALTREVLCAGSSRDRREAATVLGKDLGLFSDRVDHVHHLDVAGLLEDVARVMGPAIRDDMAMALGIDIEGECETVEDDDIE